MRMLIIGPQGAGQGTQATMLSATYQVPHVSTGDLFRAHQRETTPVREHYADLLVTVDGVGPVGDVHQRIVAAIRDR